MRMIIKSVSYKNNNVCIIGETCIGTVKGMWCGKGTPQIGKTYFFELNIADVDANDVQIISDEYSETGVFSCSDIVKFVGICESIDDVYVIRFSHDWIEMICIVGESVSIRIGDVISFSIDYEKIEIYPY